MFKKVVVGVGISAALLFVIGYLSGDSEKEGEKDKEDKKDSKIAEKKYTEENEKKLEKKVVERICFSTGKPGGNGEASLEKAFKLFQLSCKCGTKFPNNCAHFLSDALIRAGYSDLKNRDKMAVCPEGRPIRAKELLKYAQEKKTASRNDHKDRIMTGFWFVYNEYRGQGHVCLHREHHKEYTYDYKGTGNLDTFHDWPVQWHYKF